MSYLRLLYFYFVMKRINEMLGCAGAALKSIQLRLLTVICHSIIIFVLSLVEETLEPMDPERRAFRLVGGVLVSFFRSYILMDAINCTDV
jgi:hypothetical protein